MEKDLILDLVESYEQKVKHLNISLQENSFTETQIRLKAKRTAYLSIIRDLKQTVKLIENAA